MPEQPLITIVTIVKNDAFGLRKTISSVALQKSNWCEYQVIDGDSTDGTRDVIEEFAECIDVAVSEKDTGIANAFNKGIYRASGQFLLFLNAGDTLCVDALKNIHKELSDAVKKGIWVLACRVRLLVGEEGRVIGHPISKQRQLLRNYLPHQGMLIAAEAFEQLGPYDENYHLGMDYEWSLRIYPYWRRLQFNNTVLTKMNAEGVSMKFYRKTFLAYHRARVKHRKMPPFLSRLIVVFFTTKRTAGEILRSR